MHRCTTHALYRSKLWQQDHCQHPQNANPDGSTCPGWWKHSFRQRLWSLVCFQVRATSCHLTSSKSAWKSTPKCTGMCLASEGVLRLCTLLSLAPLLPDLNPLDVENITNMTSHNTKANLIAAIRRVIAELPPALVERHAPSSGSVSRWWLRLKAATLNRCQLYYIIQLAELIFSIKVLK